ncbi:MAG: EAL domain-containing protein [Acidimicrobiia bacterium]|nr:EAL domain-containing protein [Acidimicrobiia bacterium]
MANEQQLSSVLGEFARTMITDFPIQAILDHLVTRIVEVLPITAAGVTLISPGEDPRWVAASDDSALRFEKLQTELDEGPCLLAYMTGEAVSVPDLRTDSRFSRFTPRAVEAGLGAVFTFPLRHGDAALGALDLYRTSPGPLSASSMDAAQTLADVVTAYLLNAQAREELSDASARSHHVSVHDALTGLPNRLLLLERLDHAVLRARRSGKLAAVLFVDLDGFKLVNDLHGHSVGDELLVMVAQRLTAVLRPGDTLARLSGDEFVILCEDLDGAADADAIATRVGAALATPFFLADTEVEVTASVGIAFSGRGDQLSEQLLHDADTAMYQAKRGGGGRHQIIDIREQQHATQQVTLERDLRGASQRGELRTEYQPIVETAGGRMVGVEALLRWDHPSRGPVSPAQLVPLAERSHLITDIGQWVLASACTDLQRWNGRQGEQEFVLSVNVSAHQLMAAGYAASVAAVLDDTDTDPQFVTLEVTESVFVRDGERALVVLDELKRLGVKLALDDFGTGYSSLNYLKQFPIDVVKIDHGFVADLPHDEASHAIVFAVIELAHMLRMTVVAEGVETAAQHEQLAALGCDQCQGYYFAYPMPADEIDTLSRGSLVGGAAQLPAGAARGASIAR